MATPTNPDRYSEYWAYLRHIETLRFTMAGLIATVASGLLAVVHLAPDEDIDAALGVSALIFLALFIAVAAVFLVAHKRSYTHYFEQLKRIDPNVADFGKRGPFEALLVLLTLPQGAIIFSAFAFESWVSRGRLPGFSTFRAASATSSGGATSKGEPRRRTRPADAQSRRGGDHSRNRGVARVGEGPCFSRPNIAPIGLVDGLERPAGSV